MAARHIRCADVDFARLVLVGGGGRVLEAFLQNPHAGRALKEWVVDWVLGRHTDEIGPRDDHFVITEFFGHLGGPGWEVDEATVAKMRETKHDGPYTWPWCALRHWIEAKTPLPGSVLHEEYENNTWRVHAAGLIAAHPDAPADLLAEIAASTGDIGVRTALCENAAALSHADVRAELARSSSPEVLRAVVQHATGKEFARVFRKLAKRSYADARRILADGDAPGLATAEPLKIERSLLEAAVSGVDIHCALNGSDEAFQAVTRDPAAEFKRLVHRIGTRAPFTVHVAWRQVPEAWRAGVPAEDYRALVQAMAKEDPEGTLRTLEMDHANLDMIEPADLAPLFKAEKHELRVRATCLLPKLKKPQKVVPPQAELDLGLAPRQ